MKYKRLLDVLCSAVGLCILAPLILLIALSIKFTSRGPVFFRQQRVGLYGKPFWIHKFRTMAVNAEKHGPQVTIGADARITPIGRFLRKYKLDELPQLIDVLLGQMSIVGPRPEVPKYVDLYPVDIRKIVLSVRPGITDEASIQFSDESTVLAQYSQPEEAYIREIMPRKLELYVDYVTRWSLKRDATIVWRTIVKILSPN